MMRNMSDCADPRPNLQELSRKIQPSSGFRNIPAMCHKIERQCFRSPLAHPAMMMNVLLLTFYLLALLGVGGDSRPLEPRRDSELGREATTGVKPKEDRMRSLRRGPASIAAAPRTRVAANVGQRRDLRSVISGNTAGGIYPTGNPVDCVDERGIPFCINTCDSLWYAVKGTGLPMTANSCGVGGVTYDQRIIVWGGTSCAEKTCVGTSKRCCRVVIASPSHF
jgi:hypothetical protein